MILNELNSKKQKIMLNDLNFYVWKFALHFIISILTST